jgi:hypothetical protein
MPDALGAIPRHVRSIRAIRHPERHRAGATAVDVAGWLRDLGLDRYEATFRENDVDAELLPTLTADDLKDLGVTSLRHRRRLLQAIAKLRDDGAPPPPAVSVADHHPVSIYAGERRRVSHEPYSGT